MSNYEEANRRLEEASEESFSDVSEKISKLGDELAEQIVIKNIEEQLNNNEEDYSDRINYVTLFKNKYQGITPDDNCYDKDYMQRSLATVTTIVSDGLSKKYGVNLCNDLDFYFPDDYLEDTEALYEFFVIRNTENLVNYFEFELKRNRSDILTKYSKLIQTEEHSKDLFVIQAKKKFKNFDDVVILHFINEILDDMITEAKESAYVLFDKIVNLDLFEEYNNKISQLLINYGSKIVFSDDQETAEKYLVTMKNQDSRNNIRNEVVSYYLETCEIED